MSRKTRKLIWAVPLLAIFAVAGALAIFAAQPAGPAEAHGPPGPVTGVEAEADGATKIKISWTAPASGTGGAPTGYRIDVSDDTLAWMSLVANTESTDTSHTHMGLKPDTEKYYRVFAVNSAGTGPSSVDPLYDYAMTGSATMPSAVLNLRAKAVGSSKIELSWAAPARDGNAMIERYCIVADDVEPTGTTVVWPTEFDNLDTSSPPVANDEVGDACTETAEEDGLVANDGSTVSFDDGFLIVVDGKKTTYDLKMTVAESQKWRFRAYAKNSAGTSSVASNIAYADTAATPDTGKPTDVRVAATVTVTDDIDDDDDTTLLREDLNDLAYEYGSINVYWNWPVVDGKADANIGGFRYQWRVRESDATSWTKWDDDATASDGMSAVTAWEIPEPGDPVDLTADPQRQLELTTVPGDFDGKGDKLQFRVQAARTVDISDQSATGAGSWVESNVVTHQGLDTERETLRSDDDEDGVRTAITPIRIPGPVDDLEADDEKSLTQINLKWKRGSDATFSSIDVSTDSVRWIRLERNTRWTRETYNHRNVKPGTMLYYRVTPGHSRYGFGSALADGGSTKPAVEPAPMRGLTVTANGQDKLDLSWPLVGEANDGGSPIVGYLIQVNDDDDNNSRLLATGSWSSVEETTVSGAMVTDGAAGGSYTYSESPMMTAGTVRWFRVFAVNSVNAAGPTADDASSAEPKMGKTAAPAKPGAPMYLVAETARDANSEQRTELGVDLLWTQGTLAAGDTIKGYVVDRMVDGGDWERLSDSPHTGDDYTNYTDTEEPEAGEMRAYRIAAIASGGQGAWSNVAYYPVTHTVDTAHVMTTGTLAAQTVNVGDMVTVDASVGFTGDMLMYSVMSSDDAIAMATVDEMTGMVTITGVANGMATITVTATDSGMATATQTIAVTVPSPELGPPTNVMAMIDETDPGLNDIKVTWTDGANADVHHVYLVPTDFDFANIRNERVTSGMEHTFMDVAPDTYIVAVQSTSPTTEGYKYAIAPGVITVGDSQ